MVATINGFEVFKQKLICLEVDAIPVKVENSLLIYCNGIVALEPDLCANSAPYFSFNKKKNYLTSVSFTKADDGFLVLQ